MNFQKKHCNNKRTNINITRRPVADNRRNSNDSDIDNSDSDNSGSNIADSNSNSDDNNSDASLSSESDVDGDLDQTMENNISRAISMTGLSSIPLSARGRKRASTRRRSVVARGLVGFGKALLH